MTTTPRCTEESEVRLTGHDLWITRLAVQELMAIETRHEPGSSECDCEPEKTNA